MTPDRVRALALVAGAFALGLGLSAHDRDAAAQAALATAMEPALVELAVLSGLRDGEGARADVPALPVELRVYGGPDWVEGAVHRAVEAEGSFTIGAGPHRMRVDVLAQAPVTTARLWLLRRGWSVGPPRPLASRCAAWIALAPAAVACAGLFWRGAAWRWCLVAGLLAQLGAAQLPWPAPTPAPTWIEQWRDGPLGHAVLTAARSMPDQAVPVAIGVAVACAVLAAFDHRRTRGRGGWLVLAGLLGVVGLVAWIEAAWRVGVPATWSQPLGAVSALGLSSMLAAGAAAWWSRRRAAA